MGSHLGFLPESLSLQVTDFELLAQHFSVDLDLILPLLYGFLQLQLPLLQGQQPVRLVVQQVPHDEYLNIALWNMQGKCSPLLLERGTWEGGTERDMEGRGR